MDYASKRLQEIATEPLAAKPERQLPGLILQPLPSGNTAYRVRVKGDPKTRIQIPMGLSDEAFLEAYYRARRGEKMPKQGALERLKWSPRLRDTIRKMLNMARTRAKERGMPFDISHDDIMDKLEAQQGLCALSKTEFNIDATENGRRRKLSMSIDRINSSGGYTKDNIRITSVMVNMARLNWSDEDFVSMCRAVAAGAARCA